MRKTLTSIRFITIIAFCAILSACGQVGTSSLGANFPSYSSQAGANILIAPTIVDF